MDVQCLHGDQVMALLYTSVYKNLANIVPSTEEGRLFSSTLKPS